MKGRCELICEQFKLIRDNKNEVLISLKRYVFYYLNLVGYLNTASTIIYLLNEILKPCATLHICYKLQDWRVRL